MKRRQAIKNSAFMVGSVLSASTIVAIFQSCKAPAEGVTWKPDFLTVDQGKLVTKIADILIPKTDTAGAVDALVPQFVDIAVKNIFKKEQQEKFIAGFASFESACKTANGKSFRDCTPEQQLTFLQQQEKEAIESKDPTFFGTMKELVYRGFFTSEAGMTTVLAYDPVPGNYDGCIPMTKAWAS